METINDCLFDGRKFQISAEQTKIVNEILDGHRKARGKKQYHMILEAIGLPVYDWISLGYITHHIDGNHDNNVPTNLMVVTHKRHIAEHVLDEDWVERRSLAISGAWQNLSEVDKQKRRLAVSEGLQSMPQEDKAKHSTSVSKAWQSLSEEEKLERGLMISEAWENLSDEEKQRQGLAISKGKAKRWEAMTIEERQQETLVRSETQIKYWEVMSEKDRNCLRLAMSKGHYKSQKDDPLEFPDGQFTARDYALLHNISIPATGLRLARFWRNKILKVSVNRTGGYCNLYEVDLGVTRLELWNDGQSLKD